MKYFLLIMVLAYGTFTQASQGNSSHGRGHQGNPGSHTSSGGSSNSGSNAGAVARASSSVSSGDATGGSVGVGDTTVTTSNDVKYPVSTAATIVPAACQTGASVQSDDVGIAIVSSDPLCDYYKAAEASYRAYQKEMTVCIAVCSVECTTEGYVYAEKTTCDLAQEYLDDYHVNLEMAQELVESAEFSGKVDRNVSGWSKFLMFLLAAVAIL